jgi:hypothetical protein
MGRVLESLLVFRMRREVVCREHLASRVPRLGSLPRARALTHLLVSDVFAILCARRRDRARNRRGSKII